MVNVYNIVIIIKNSYRNTEHLQQSAGHGSWVRSYIYYYLLYFLNVVVSTSLYTSFQFGINSLKRFCQLYVHYTPNNNGHLSESSELSITMRTNEMYSVKLKSTIRYLRTRIYIGTYILILIRKGGYLWRDALNLKVPIDVTFEIDS